MKGKELRSIRRRLALTQAELAKKIGVAPNTIARYERDELPVTEPVARLARAILSNERTSR